MSILNEYIAAENIKAGDRFITVGNITYIAAEAAYVGDKIVDVFAYQVNDGKRSGIGSNLIMDLGQMVHRA